MQEIYKITLELLRDKNYLFEYIYKNMKNNYYWSDEWSEELYIELAKCGFIATSYDTLDGLILLPEIQFSYALIEFQNLHISKKVKKLLKKDDYIFLFNSHFEEVLEHIESQHQHNWLKGEYKELLKCIYRNNYDNFKLISIALISKDNGKLIAGEIGYTIGKTYTSLSGFSSREKFYANYGTLQLVLLGKYLQRQGFSFWNLGHPHMEYKKRLGAQILDREEFLDLWYEESKKKLYTTRSENE